jgi:hypothetical protein
MKQPWRLLWGAVLSLCVLAAWAALLAYLGVFGNRASAGPEDHAIKVVRGLGGSVVYREPEPDGPVVWVILKGTGVTDAELRELAGLQSLRYLDLCSTKVTDAGMKELAVLQQLRELYLLNSQVTGAGLTELAGLKQLQKLLIGPTQLTTSGRFDLGLLKPFQQFQTLRVSSADRNYDWMIPLGWDERIREQLKDILPHCRINPRPER